MRVRSSDKSIFPISLSRILTMPFVGKIRVARIFKSVDFPAPLGPRITQRSPFWILKSKGPKISRPPRETLTPCIARMLI